MRAVVRNGYSGYLSVEHDKANKLGGDHAESTAIARWYAKHVLERIAAEEVAR
jgi:inosose dehydratase